MKYRIRNFIINLFLSVNLIILFFRVFLFLIFSLPIFIRSVIFDFEIVCMGIKRFSFLILLDFYSIVFLRAVLLISASVFTFSASYMANDKHFKRFHYLLFTFVISIFLLIVSPNLISILLGWDGLGISSYLLVIYYSRKKSYNAGIVTLLSNRIGDALLILALCFTIFLRSYNINNFFFEIKKDFFWVVLIISIAGCTKRAQIPFRAWLPAAIAAPTPVSSLVHSSTLVTAGVYLIFRFDRILVFLNVNGILLVLGSLTILIARWSAFFEIDLKKIVALSTLRQLGVIITSLGAGFRVLGFFHLLTHAFFKAILFIGAGNIIHASERYQDMRVMGGSAEILPYSKSVIVGASIRLSGLPFISAFYSKEMIIERILTKNLSFVRYLILILGVFMTIFYRFRLISTALLWVNRQRSLFTKNDLDPLVNLRISLLFIPAISGGGAIRYLIKINSFFLIPATLKYTNLFMVVISVVIVYLYWIVETVQLGIGFWISAKLWGLPIFTTCTPVVVISNFGDFLHKLLRFSYVMWVFTRFFQNGGIFLLSYRIGFQKKFFIRFLSNFFMVTIFFFIINS